MMATTHAIVGVTIAKAVPDPILAGVLIVTSHYLMDLIPHWDFGTDWKSRSKGATGVLAAIDTLMAYLIVWIIFSSQLPLLTILVAASLADLPDWLEAPYFILMASKEGHHKASGGTFGLWLGKIHKFQEDYIHTKANFTQGVLTQIVTVIFFYLLLHPHL